MAGASVVVVVAVVVALAAAVAVALLATLALRGVLVVALASPASKPLCLHQTK